jgi:anti-sigma regulatory factor (Ser/Thr protein kinase)
MVDFAFELSGSRKSMTLGSQLAHPIFGEVSKEGRLLRADDALRKLNQRAGGAEGGIIAIPSLYNLARLSARLQMRLARAVRVSDEAESLELWVEAEPVGEITRLAILSWRNLGQYPVPANAGEIANAMLGSDQSILHFDLSLRLIKTEGPAIADIVTADFGQSASDLFPKWLETNQVSAELIARINAMAAFAPTRALLKSGEAIILSGRPTHSMAGALAGYECRLEAVQAPSVADAVDSETSTPGALFGKHLAPVLRQPLGRIIANAETIGSELQGPIRENYAAYARDIANAARHLSALVDDLGDLEAIERADFSTAPDKIELGDVATRVAGLLALKAADHSIRLITPDDGIKIGATAEFRRVLQIMLNLVTNAVRYSPDGTEVRIEIGKADQFSFISVTDEGQGIKPEDRDRVFEKFERLGRSGDGGSGLGLYISHRLARAMGGDLTVGEATGGGAVFTLRLPSN